MWGPIRAGWHASQSWLGCALCLHNQPAHSFSHNCCLVLLLRPDCLQTIITQHPRRLQSGRARASPISSWTPTSFSVFSLQLKSMLARASLTTAKTPLSGGLAVSSSTPQRQCCCVLPSFCPTPTSLPCRPLGSFQSPLFPPPYSLLAASLLDYSQPISCITLNTAKLRPCIMSMSKLQDCTQEAGLCAALPAVWHISHLGFVVSPYLCTLRTWTVSQFI